jgi:flagellar basal-body rod protein FlgF
VQDAGSYIDRSTGELETTGNPFDIALDGKGYLGVATQQGTMYSRDGHLQVGSDNTLLGDGGSPVLGADGSPIQLPDGYSQIQIKGDGSIKALVNGRWTDVAQIGVFMPNDPTLMQQSGSGLLSAPQNAMQPVTPDIGGAKIVQGSIESSTVKPMKEIANMTELSRAYDRLQSLLTEDSDLEEKMIDALSRES